MAPGGPPGGGRGRGGKFKKFTRGGGKHFSRDLRPLDAEGNEIGGKPSDESEEEESEEEESEEEEAKGKPVLTREERRAAQKAKKEAAIARKKNTTAQPGDLPSSSDEDEESDDDMPMPANPNHSSAARKQASAAPLSVDDATDGVKNISVSKGKSAVELSRREREALQAQQAKERYMKLHEAGKTDEAKADLARLAVIKEKREAEAARKQAEKEEREEAEKAKKTELEVREAKRREAAMGPAKGKGKVKGK